MKKFRCFHQYLTTREWLCLWNKIWLNSMQNVNFIWNNTILHVLIKSFFIYAKFKVEWNISNLKFFKNLIILQLVAHINWKLIMLKPQAMSLQLVSRNTHCPLSVKTGRYKWHHQLTIRELTNIHNLTTRRVWLAWNHGMMVPWEKVFRASNPVSSCYRVGTFHGRDLFSALKQCWTFLNFYTKLLWNLCLYKNLYMSVHSKKTQMSCGVNHLITSKWLNKLWCIHTTEYYATIKKEKLLYIPQPGWIYR